MNKVVKIFIGIVVSAVLALYISLPKQATLQIPLPNREPLSIPIHGSVFALNLPGGKQWYKEFSFKRGLDIQGGMQVVLQADVAHLSDVDKVEALNAAREIILRRVDMFGIAEPSVQTSIAGDQYRLIVELPGVVDQQQALELVGRTAQLEFQLLQESSIPLTMDENGELVASGSAQPEISLLPTGITGSQLKRATPQLDPNTYEPVVSLEFNDEGRDLFAKVTEEHVGERLGIFIDGVPLLAPVINTPILDGRAIISGGFQSEEAKQLSVQLNAGALPISISVLEQRTVGASLGEQAVMASTRAGLVGLGLVMLFMILYYGSKGLLASIALCIYALYTMALYKIIGVTLTLPGIAGLLLSIGMAVDSNILIFERMKEELRLGRPFAQAMELGFGRAWDSIKDANLTTIFTALILINPLNLRFLNTAGMVRGFGVTLLLGVLLSLFTGIVVTRTLMRLFLKDTTAKERA